MSDLFPIHETQPSRRQIAEKKSRYNYYKAELRSDFSKRCGYCGTADYYSGGQRGFHIDHFAPKSKFSELTHEYHNLVYCCPICNIGKSDDWPSDDPLISQLNSTGYVDPCSAEYGQHLARDRTGKIIHRTPLGSYIHDKLKLSLKRRQICWLIDKMEEQARFLSNLIVADEHNMALLQSYHKLVNEYMKYIGILKSE